MSKLCRRDGTQSDWRAFYSQYQDLIRTWCLQFGVNASDMDDIFHDTLLKLIASLPTYDAASGHRFRSWLKTVVRNALIDRLRMLENSPFPTLLGDGSLLSSPENSHSSVSEGIDALADQITERSTSAAVILSRSRLRVTEPTWDAFIRRELLGEQVAEIATSLGIKKASVYQSVSRVRTIIREESRDYFGDAGSD